MPNLTYLGSHSVEIPLLTEKCQIGIEKETRLKETCIVKVVRTEAVKPSLRKRDMEEEEP